MLITMMNNNDNIDRLIVKVLETVEIVGGIVDQPSEAPSIGIGAPTNVSASQLEQTSSSEGSTPFSTSSLSSTSDPFNNLDVIDDDTTNQHSEVNQPSDAMQNRNNMSMYTNRKYRIHLGTLPGFYTSSIFNYEESRWRHEELVNLLSQFRSNLKNALVENYQFDIALKDAFSTTEVWGLEPYASIIFESNTLTRVEGVAAIIGRIFQQDDIGIFDEEYDYHEQSIGTSTDGFSTHRFFVISAVNEPNGMPIPGPDASTIMTTIHEIYPHLSGQFGRTSETIELHDFGNDGPDLIANDLQDILEKIRTELNQPYQVVEGKAKSKLLWNTEYDKAIKQAEFEVLANIVAIVRLHDTLYPPPPHN